MSAKTKKTPAKEGVKKSGGYKEDHGIPQSNKMPVPHIHLKHTRSWPGWMESPASAEEKKNLQKKTVP